RSKLRDAVAVRVAEQRNSVRARDRGARLLHVAPEEPSTNALSVVRAFWRVRLGDEHVAVREHVEPTRMVQAFRERVDQGSGRGGGPVVSAPTLWRGERTRPHA